MNNRNVLKNRQRMTTLCLLSMLSIAGLATVSFASYNYDSVRWMNPRLHGNTGGLRWVITIPVIDSEQRRGESKGEKPVVVKTKPRISLFFPIKTTKDLARTPYRIKSTRTAPPKRTRR
jgi:hypothetical protein